MIVVCKKNCKVKTGTAYLSGYGDQYKDFEVGKFYEVFASGGRLNIGSHSKQYGAEITIEFLKENFEEIKVWQ